MVSFQCEGCGDVIKKPKLDSHRNQCHGATFSCLDCSVHFRGTEYRSHTSCITEDQKYQGHLYREKPTKATKRKSVSIIEPNDNKALVPASRHAYVEDAPDADGGAPPPHVPSPPPAVLEEPSESVNVFDFLVNDTTPNASRERVATKKNYRNSEEQLPSNRYDEEGFTYGAEPVNPRPLSGENSSFVSLDFMTPAAKESWSKLDKKQLPESTKHSRTGSTDKKRKRGQVEDPYTETTTYELEGDTLMPDAPQTASRSAELAHSGLTGGLTRLLSHEDDEHYPFPPTPSEREKERQTSRRDRHQHEDPASPLKRSRKSRDAEESNSRDRNGLGISIKGRASKAMSVISGAGVLAAFTNPAAAQNQQSPPSQALVRKEKGGKRASDEDYERERGGSQIRGEKKKHKVHRHNGTARDNVKFEGSRSARRRSGRDDRSRSPEQRNGHGHEHGKVKAIEYYKSSREESDSDSDANGNAAMVLFGAGGKNRVRCESFLGHVTKGPESERGCSLNKALKRWHRGGGVRRGEEKADEERELWKGLRLKRNDRGEIVVFF